MNRFASQYGFIVTAMTFAFGEGNAAVAYDEENNAATLSSEQLGAINKHIGHQQAQLKDANDALEALGSQHATESKEKDAKIAELNARIAELEGSQAAQPASGAKADSDPNAEHNPTPWVDPNAEHNKTAAKMTGGK